MGFLTTFVTLGIVQQFDARLLDGASVWAKPLKFAISTAVHFGSIALAVRWLRPAWGGSGWMTALAAASIAAAVIEVEERTGFQPSKVVAVARVAEPNVDSAGSA